MRVPHHRVWERPCKHFFCFDCVEKRIMHGFLNNNSIYPFRCSPVCRTSWTKHEIDRLKCLDDDISRVYQLKCEKARIQDRIVYCNVCDVDFLTDTANDSNPFCVKCENFVINNCSKCSKEHHVSILCETFAETENIFTEYIKSISTSICCCGRYLTRIDGCPHVDCFCGRQNIVENITDDYPFPYYSNVPRLKIML